MSLIVDPPDGRYPARTERVRERDAAFAAMRDGTTFDTWYDLNLYDRCITRGMPGAMIPGFYNHNYQILQTPDHVVTLVEMIHEARIIPLDGRAHLPSQIGQWLGDSRARWEGDTLVVETANLTPRGDQRVRYLVQAGSGQAHVVERFTRVAADRIDYSFTVTDPATYASPWTAEIPMVPLGGELFEYACHEGNLTTGCRTSWRAPARPSGSRRPDRASKESRLRARAGGSTTNGGVHLSNRAWRRPLEDWRQSAPRRCVRQPAVAEAEQEPSRVAGVPRSLSRGSPCPLV